MSLFEIVSSINTLLLNLRKNIIISRSFYKKAVFVAIALTPIWAPAHSFGSVTRLLHFEWHYDTSVSDLAGYTVYRNGIPIADIRDPTAQEIDQVVVLESGANFFTMTAFDKTGYESSHSTPYVLDVPPEDDSGNLLPIAKITTSGTVGEASFFVEFDAAGSIDYDGAIIEYSWNFGDGSGSEGDLADHAFDSAGIYQTVLTVKDNEGAISTAETTITVFDPSETPNDPPVAYNSAWQLHENTTAGGILAASDPDGDNLTYSLVRRTSRGTVTIINAATGAFTYTPEANANGMDSFSFKVNDGKGDSNVATVTVTISAANDLPVARNDVAATGEDTAVFIPVLVNDSDVDGDNLTVSVVGRAAFGEVRIDGSGIVYTPRSDWSGLDTLSYTVSDGRGGEDTATVNVTVTAINDVPVANSSEVTTNEDIALSGLLSATDAEHDTLRYSIVTNGREGSAVIMNAASGSFFYIPAANANGTDSFSFKANDGKGDSKVATVTLTINAANDLPVARNDVAATSEDTAVFIPVLVNDSDVDGDNLTVSVVGRAAFGEVRIDGSGIVYTPRSGWSGLDTFSYTVSDGRGGEDTATVNVNVSKVYQRVNSPPEAANGYLSTFKDTAVSGSMVGTDRDGDTLSYSIVAKSSLGSITIIDKATGFFSYKPHAGASGTDSFTFMANDGQACSNIATVFIRIESVAD